MTKQLIELFECVSEDKTRRMKKDERERKKNQNKTNYCFIFCSSLVTQRHLADTLRTNRQDFHRPGWVFRYWVLG